MKCAVIHDWLVTYAGSEKVLEQILKIYPDADLYSLVDFLQPGERDFVLNKTVHTSFVQHLPFARKRYRDYLLFMPYAIEQVDVSGYDLVISSNHAVSKGVLTTADQLHVCYCNTPMRYAWDLYHQYLKEARLDRGIKGKIAKVILHYIRMWDMNAAQRVDHFVANSHYIARRIRKVYRRDAAVIYPPVDISLFEPGGPREDFYVTASRMVPYKRMDIIVEAFAQMPDKKLIVIGDGPDFEKIKKRARKNIEFLGYQHDSILKQYLQKAKAFVFAAEEDFGILPVEAQACGTPVIAYGKGGILETVIVNTTGIFFEKQTAQSLMSAVQEFEKSRERFNPGEIRKNAERFSRERFQQEFKGFVDEKTALFRGKK